MSIFNIHKNVTADGVVITEGLRVYSNELETGVVVGRDQGRCCGRGEAGGHPKAQLRPSGMDGWFTDHPAGAKAVTAGCYCRHNHWFDVKYDNGGGGMFDGERITTTFQGKKA